MTMPDGPGAADATTDATRGGARGGPADLHTGSGVSFALPKTPWEIAGVIPGYHANRPKFTAQAGEALASFVADSYTKVAVVVGSGAAAVGDVLKDKFAKVVVVVPSVDEAQKLFGEYKNVTYVDMNTNFAPAVMAALEGQSLGAVIGSQSFGYQAMYDLIKDLGTPSGLVVANISHQRGRIGVSSASPQGLPAFATLQEDLNTYYASAIPPELKDHHDRLNGGQKDFLAPLPGSRLQTPSPTELVPHEMQMSRADMVRFWRTWTALVYACCQTPHDISRHIGMPNLPPTRSGEADHNAQLDAALEQANPVDSSPPPRWSVEFPINMAAMRLN